MKLIFFNVRLYNKLGIFRGLNPPTRTLNSFTKLVNLFPPFSLHSNVTQCRCLSLCELIYANQSIFCTQDFSLSRLKASTMCKVISRTRIYSSRANKNQFSVHFYTPRASNLFLSLCDCSQNIFFLLFFSSSSPVLISQGEELFDNLSDLSVI